MGQTGLVPTTFFKFFPFSHKIVLTAFFEFVVVWFEVEDWDITGEVGVGLDDLTDELCCESFTRMIGDENVNPFALR